MKHLNGNWQKVKIIDYKQILIDYSKELGFDKIGFAKAEVLKDEFANFKEWLDLGYFAGMNWIKKNPEKRENISIILENINTVIVTATNYFTPFKYSSDIGQISRYAWGYDYHDIILPKLRELTRKIHRSFPETISKCYVDTGPILEKQWAVKAGIGWQGKNSLLLTKEYGSWVFLGVILTTAKYEPDTQINDYCGKCTACIQACPTGAIVQEKVVDSDKCISYWNIETKGDVNFPPEISKNLNGWFFGCDICQDVCPWNKKAKVTNDKSFFPINGETNVNPLEIINMTDDEFKIRFKNSPLKRPKLAGLKRNAYVLK